MSDFSNLPVDERIFLDIWEIPGNSEKIIPIDFSDPKEAAIFQSITSIANLAIACDMLFTTLDRSVATELAKAVERRILSAVALFPFRFPVNTILKLPSELDAWKAWSGKPADGVHSNLETILNIVWAQRLGDYQTDLITSMKLSLDSRFNAYGPVVFLTKRYLSHKTGIPIDPQSCFPEVGLEHFAQYNYYLMGIFQSVMAYAK
ncbi:MAG TPA: hypothetical protein VNV15_04320 [Opitutaceae bacterium]|jgi:hypothetical protein|nr:hypothetical protein [Opitutaceae bacterium]